MQIKSWALILKSLFQNKTSDLSVKYILINVHQIISRVSSKNKGKRAKSKNSVKKTKSKQKKKKRYKETENSVARSRTQFICMCKQLLDH